ncbi:NAD(P)-binding domain-containing protein [Streptomyces sp. NPDC000410]|uniref:NAD(P)-dependent oxidoreductase n=1 Tax=Streptomyces sp. NPDC000410 TaxID=3154254 RepID=UPI0033280FBC
MSKQPVTVIGLGNLGHVVAETFLAQGHPTTVWNRSPAKADALVARGAVRADTVAEAVAAGELVVVVVLDQDVARELLTPAADALKGKALLNVTSGIPESVRELADWVTGHGAAYLAGAVYAVPQTVGTDEAFVLLSGSRETYDSYLPQLRLLGDPVYVGEAAELASVYDVALLSGMYGMFAGFFQAVALGGSAGIEAARITGLLVRWLKEATPILPAFAEEIDAGNYATETSNLDINATGLAHILTATRQQGVGTELLAPLQALFDQQIAAGHGGDSLSRTIESLR